MSINEWNKVNKDREKFGYMITNNSREALLLDDKNENNLYDDGIVKGIMAL